MGMSREAPPQGRRPGKKSIAPALCNILGTLVLVSAILVCLPAVVPQALGYEVFCVVSGSMEPGIHKVEGEFTTKGDANKGEDPGRVPYDALLGKVEYHVPALGDVLAVLTSVVGKVYLLAFAACGAMLNLLAGRLRQR